MGEPVHIRKVLRGVGLPRRREPEHPPSPRLLMLAGRVTEKLRELRSWETLLSGDPIAWAHGTSRNSELALRVALRSREILDECRRWLERHGWH